MTAPGGVWSGGYLLFGGGCLLQGDLVRGVPSPGGCLLPGGSGPRECLVETPPDGYCCGRYASYWNVFL